MADAAPMIGPGDVLLNVISLLAGAGITIIFQRISASTRQLDELFELLIELADNADQAARAHASGQVDNQSRFATQTKSAILAKKIKIQLRTSPDYPKVRRALGLLEFSFNHCDPDFGPPTLSAAEAAEEIRLREDELRSALDLAASRRPVWRIAKFLRG